MPEKSAEEQINSYPPSNRVASGSELPYRKPRQKRGKKKFESILRAANHLIELKGVHNFGLYDIAEHAGVATGSVYHFFPNIEAVFAALVEHYNYEFAKIASENIPPNEVESWSDVIWHRIEKSREYMNSNKQVLIVILGPGQTWQTRLVDTVGNTANARTLWKNLTEYFEIPKLPDPVELLHLAIKITESIWQLSYQRHGRVTEEMQQETYRAICAYLELYWPKYLPCKHLISTD